jgi:CubicO group peptidase (beta-lactamase class C family)
MKSIITDRDIDAGELGNETMTDMIFEDAEKLGFDRQRLDAIPAFFDSYLEREKLSGISILVAREGKVAHLSHQGNSAFDGGFALNDEAIFRIYSMTKPVTSVALMMLVEQSKLTLQDPVSKFIPSLKDLRVFDQGTAQDYTTRKPAREMTVHDLLTHQSGLTYDFMMSHPVDALYRNSKDLGVRTEHLTLEQVVDQLADFPLVFDPGTQWNYSVSTDVVGRLVEIVSGQSLDAFFEDHIFKPLGMHDTSFTIADDKRHRLTHNYARSPITGKTSLADSPEKTLYAPGRTFLSGGGGLLSTVSDYHKFIDMLRLGGSTKSARILSRKTVAYMTSNHLPNNETLMDRASGSFSEVSYGGTGFGLGFSTVIAPNYTATVSSLGNFSWGGLASTFFWVDPVEDMSVILMTQLMPSGTYPLRPQLTQLVYAALK